jgi:hypothetical protein
LSPEAKRKIQSTVFETINTINEGISFESNFPQKNLSAIKGDIKTLNGMLSDQYNQSLQLVCNILMFRNGSWFKSAG